MAYKRSFKRRPTYRKRRGGFKKPGWTWGNAAAMARSALKGVSYLKGLVNSELLKRTTTGTNTVKLYTSSPIPYDCYHLTALPVGDADDQRTGNSVLIRSIDFRLTMQWAPPFSGDDEPQPYAGFVRVLVVRDKQTEGDSQDPGLGAVLQSLTVNSHLNDTTVGRFTILKDRVYQLSRFKPVLNFDYRGLMRQHARYNGDSASDIQKDGTYVFIFGESSVWESDFTPTYNYEYRLSYHDN